MREAEIVRTHKDTWFSVIMGDNMFLCLSEEGHYPTCCVVSMSEERIVTPDTTGQIIKMVRETQEDQELSDDVLMYEFARCEYI